MLFAYLVEFAQVLLLLLVHHNVDPGDVLADNANLGELGGGPAGDFSNLESGELILQLLELLAELLLALLAELVALIASLETKLST